MLPWGSCAVAALARRNLEGTRATLEARAGNFEIIADDALSFVKAATIFGRRRSLSFRRSLLGIQLEIDFYVVMFAVAEAGWRRVNLRDAFCNRSHRFIHDDIFGWLDDFETGHAPISLDSHFDERRNFGAGGGVSRRLDPRAVKTVVQHIAIPPELRWAAPAAGVPNFAG